MNLSRIPKNARWYLAGGILAFLLLLLGVLQYRANRQLRDVLQQQMLTDAQTSLLRIRHGVEDELSPICNQLDVSRPNSEGPDLQQYAADFASWRTTTDHPGLIVSIFVYEYANRARPRLLRLSPDGKQFEPSNWPYDFRKLRDYLAAEAASAKYWDEPEPPGVHEESSASFPWFVDQNIPALVHPNRDDEGDLSFVIVQLDERVLAHTILPQLAQREFGSNGQLAYRVALVNGTDYNVVLYASEPGFGSRRDSAPDAQINVFGPPSVVAGNASASQKGGPPAEARGPSAVKDHGPEPPFILSASQAAMADPLRRKIEPIRYGNVGDGWTLIATHRKGSVEAAVADLFRRNLTIDFGVLLVLAAMIATMVVSVRRAQQLAQMRMDFVASVSHELRTPLTGIVSSAQNIADGLVNDKQRASQYGLAIVNQALQLSELIEEILLFSATERGRVYQRQPLEVERVIAASLAGTAGQVNSAGIDVEQHIEPGLPAIWGDSQALTQCLQNLIVNAIKYGGNAHWIGIRAYSDGDPNFGGEVVITVEDKGRGISPEDLKKIFRPFYRSPSVTDEQIHGSGLGLAIVKSVTEAMGGRLTVKSEPGKGSAFSVHLPTIAERNPIAARTG